jgi:hypothetical protein
MAAVLNSARLVSSQECASGFCGGIQWFAGETLRQATTAKGIETYARLAKNGFDWQRQLTASDSEIQPTAQLAGAQFAGDVGNIASALTAPVQAANVWGSLYTVVTQPSFGHSYEILASGVRVVPPLYDGLKVLNDRSFVAVDPKTMDIFSKVFTGAVLFLSFDEIVRNFSRLAVAIQVRSEDKATSTLPEVSFDFRHQDAGRQIWAALIDLARAVSYAAMAALTLLSAFFIVIPHAAIWILACTTSALIFTLIGEFVKAASRESSEQYLEGLALTQAKKDEGFRFGGLGDPLTRPAAFSLSALPV